MSTETQSTYLFNKSRLKKICIAISLLLFLILPLASLQVGVPADEPIDIAYGRKALDYYKSFGADKSFLQLEVLDNKFPYQKYYGALFEAGSVAIADLLNTNIFSTRHFLVGICTAILILTSVLFAAELFGWLVAFIALLLLIGSPIFIGNGLFNSKDIPMALSFMLAFYFFVRLLKNLPALSWKNLLGVGTGIAITIGIRMGGILLISYLVVFLLFFLAVNTEVRTKIFSTAQSSRKFILKIALTFIASVLIGCLFYPNFFIAGYSHITEALAVARNFPVKIIMLFRGEVIYANEIPWDYLPVCMAITFPLTVIAGIILFAVNRFREQKTISWRHFILAYSILFLLVYVAITRQIIYNGWRHVTFIYPVIVTAAAIGITELFSSVQKIIYRTAILLVFALLTAKTIWWMIEAHPYEYVYYNELQGGLKGAYTYYDTDYQQLAASESFHWLINSNEYKSDTSSLKEVLTNNESIQFDNQATQPDLKIRQSSFLRLNYHPMDFAILSSVFIEPMILRNFFPPKKVIHDVSVDGVPLSYVIQRENDFLVKGKFYFDNSKLDSAFVFLKKAYQYDETDFRIYPLLAHCYYLQGYPQSALELCDRYLHYFPDDPNALREVSMIQTAVDSSGRK